jgi:hypothetical protein
MKIYTATRATRERVVLASRVTAGYELLPLALSNSSCSPLITRLTTASMFMFLRKSACVITMSNMYMPNVLASSGQQRGVVVI